MLRSAILGEKKITGPFSTNATTTTAQKIKFSIKNFFSKCDQIRRKLRILSHLLKKSLIENFIFCAVYKLSLNNFGHCDQIWAHLLNSRQNLVIV